MSLINTPVTPFQATAYHNGKFVPVIGAELQGQVVGRRLLPGRLHVRLPDRARRPGRPLRRVQEARRRDLRRVDRHALHAQGLARHLATRSARSKYPLVGDPNHQLARYFDVLITEGEDAGLALRGTFVIDPDGRIKTIEVHDNGIGRDAKETLRKREGGPVRRRPPGRSLPRQVERRRGDAHAVARPGRQDLSPSPPAAQLRELPSRLRGPRPQADRQ